MRCRFQHVIGVCLGLACLTSWMAAPVSAQTVGGPRPLSTAPRDWGVLTAFRTVLDVKHLNGADADTRFNWDADLSVDVDVVDAGLFRGNLYVNVETIIGDELRDIDPNQNNYTADMSAFVRLPHGELVTTFHHVSRHLSDRGTADSISWNMFGVGYGHQFALGPVNVETGGRALWTVERAGVDYVGQYEVYARLARPVTERFVLFAGAEGVALTVDPLIQGRDNQQGGRVEGGLRIRTPAAPVDLFVAHEQRIDATSSLRDRTRWAQFGIRVTAGLP